MFYNRSKDYDNLYHFREIFSKKYDYRWYSFCSQHINYNKDCHICINGQWVDESKPKEIF